MDNISLKIIEFLWKIIFYRFTKILFYVLVGYEVFAYIHAKIYNIRSVI